MAGLARLSLLLTTTQTQAMRSITHRRHQTFGQHGTRRTNTQHRNAVTRVSWVVALKEPRMRMPYATGAATQQPCALSHAIRGQQRGAKPIGTVPCPCQAPEVTGAQATTPATTRRARARVTHTKGTPHVHSQVLRNLWRAAKVSTYGGSPCPHPTYCVDPQRPTPNTKDIACDTQSPPPPQPYLQTVLLACSVICHGH